MSQTKSQLINPISGNINLTGIITATTAIVGSAVTINSSGVNVSGVVTATSFVGSGVNLTGVASTDNIRTATPARFLSNISVSGIATVTTLDSSTFKNYAETINVVGNTGTAATINIANGNFVTATLTGNCTFTFTTGVASNAVSFTLFLTNDATPSRVITWPGTVVWPGGTTPTRTTTASKSDIYTFFTLNNGTTWYGNIAQYNY